MAACVKLTHKATNTSFCLTFSKRPPRVGVGIRRCAFCYPRIYNSLRNLVLETVVKDQIYISYLNFYSVPSPSWSFPGYEWRRWQWPSSSCWAVCISSCENYNLQLGWGWEIQLYPQVSHPQSPELIRIPPASVPGDSAAVDSGWCG